MNELKGIHWTNKGIEMNELPRIEMNELKEWIELYEWNDWLEMNELTWMNWNEWLETNELKRMNWDEAIGSNELNWMNEMTGLTWMIWNESGKNISFFVFFCDQLLDDDVVDIWNRALATVSCTFCRPHLQKVVLDRQFFTIFIWSTTWWRCGRQMKWSSGYSRAHTLSTSLSTSSWKSGATPSQFVTILC